MKHRIIQLLTMLCIMPVSGVVLAHNGEHMSYSFLHGLVHPLSGLDHLLALFAVGLWASTLNTRNSGTVLLAFTGALLAGALLAVAGITLPGIEAGIATSILVAGLLLAFMRVSAVTGITLVMLFAVFHGQAHVMSAAADLAYMGYSLGFLLITMALLMAGQVLGYGLQALRAEWPIRSAGLLSAGMGAWLLLG
jgi:urease accessory protein